MVKVLHGHIYDVLPLEETVQDINSQYWELRAEPIPEDDSLAETNSGDLVRRLTVAHFVVEKAGGHTQHYGDPLALLVCPNETLISLKQRVLKRLKVAVEEFATWKWAIVTPQNATEMVDDNTDVLEIWDRLTHGTSTSMETCYVGMLHESKNFRRPPRQNHSASSEAQIKLL